MNDISLLGVSPRALSLGPLFLKFCGNNQVEGIGYDCKLSLRTSFYSTVNFTIEKLNFVV